MRCHFHTSAFGPKRHPRPPRPSPWHEASVSDLPHPPGHTLLCFSFFSLSVDCRWRSSGWFPSFSRRLGGWKWGPFKKIGYFAGWGACDGGLFHLDRWIGRLRREFSIFFTDCGCGFVTWGTWLDGLWSRGMLCTEAFLPSRLYEASRCPPAIAM